jgi:hypothetical protein
VGIGQLAPEFDVAEWIGKPQPLAGLRGQVVLVETFQMLCPGCVTHGLPQAQRVQATFPDVAVVGIHTVFEHHDAMTPVALRAFLSEYRIGFPVGIDRHDDDPIPATMRRYGLQGTPSTILIDRLGRLRLTAFGALDDLQLGAHLGRLLAEPDGLVLIPRAHPTGTPASPPIAAEAVAGGPTCQPNSDCS